MLIRLHYFLVSFVVSSIYCDMDGGSVKITLQIFHFVHVFVGDVCTCISRILLVHHS